MLTLIDQLPPELDRIRYGAELYDAGRRADAGLPFALILPLIDADGTRTRCLITDPAAHAARWQRRTLTAAEKRRYAEAFAVLNAFVANDAEGGRDDWYERAWALHQDDDTGGGAA